LIIRKLTRKRILKREKSTLKLSDGSTIHDSGSPNRTGNSPNSNGTGDSPNSNCSSPNHAHEESASDYDATEPAPYAPEPASDITENDDPLPGLKHISLYQLIQMARNAHQFERRIHTLETDISHFRHRLQCSDYVTQSLQEQLLLTRVDLLEDALSLMMEDGSFPKALKMGMIPSFSSAIEE